MTTLEEKEKIKFINELKDFYNITKEYIIYLWNKIPSIFRSLFIIILWIFIMISWTNNIFNINYPWKILFIPSSLFCIIFLGCLYTYTEIKKQWGKWRKHD
jgi:hypothetical protein